MIGAVVCAPFFEEFLFRGHLQTLLREPPGLFDLRRRPAAVDSPAPYAGGRHGTWRRCRCNMSRCRRPRRRSVPDQSIWQTWSPIVLSSMVFALVHPALDLAANFFPRDLPGIRLRADGQSLDHHHHACAVQCFPDFRISIIPGFDRPYAGAAVAELQQELHEQHDFDR